MKKLLIVVDMQKDFTSGVLGNDACEAAVGKVADVIKAHTYDKIYLTMDTHRPDQYLSTQEGRKLPVPHCLKGTDGWQIRDEIMGVMKETYSGCEYEILNKHSFGSLLLGNILQTEYLTDQEDLQIDFVGVCTGICVISNVLIVKAALPEARICVIENACACVTPESHKTAIAAMKMCQVDII